VTFYESNDEVQPTGDEPDEFVGGPPRGEPRDDDPISAIETQNMPGDHRVPASAHPLRDGKGGEGASDAERAGAASDAERADGASDVKGDERARNDAADDAG
jgi:hypothetical protein